MRARPLSRVGRVLVSGAALGCATATARVASEPPAGIASAPPLGAAGARPSAAAASRASTGAPAPAGPSASADPGGPPHLGPAREREPTGEPAPALDDAKLLAELARLERYCEPALSRDEGRWSAGCACCPPFDECAHRADGRRFVLDAVYPLRAEVEGAFTAVGARETAAVFAGCEPHSSNFGGTLVVAATDTGPERRVYRSGISGEACRALRRRDGRDWLVCRSGDVHQGVGRTAVLVADLALPEEDPASVRVLFDGVDNLASVCVWGDAEPPPAIAFSAVTFRVSDLDRDGWDDVEVNARVRRGTRTPAVARACDAWNARASRTDERPPYAALGAERAVRLEFLQQGDDLTATPATRHTLDGLLAGYDRGE